MVMDYYGVIISLFIYTNITQKPWRQKVYEYTMKYKTE